MQDIEKKQYIEYLRVVAMFAVVVTHVCVTAISDFFVEGEDSILAGVSFYYSIRNILHFAVPVFFMISGALLITPQKIITIKQLFNKYILKYIGIIGIFGWIYALMEKIFYLKSFKFSCIYESFINMIQGDTWEHMWYMYSLLGVMLILPILRSVAQYLENKEIKYLFMVAFLFLSILPLIETWLGIKLGIKIPFNIWCFYMLIGYWIDKGKISLKTSSCYVFLFLGMILLIINAYFNVYLEWKLHLADYTSPVICLISMSIFTLFYRNLNHEIKILNNIVKFFSRYSLGIYLVHMIWVNILYKFVKINPFKYNIFFILVLLSVFITCASAMVTAVLKRIPLFRKLV